MRAGDIVVRKFGDGIWNPRGIILRELKEGGSPIGPKYWRVRWFGPEKQEVSISSVYLEVISESR